MRKPIFCPIGHFGIRYLLLSVISLFIIGGVAAQGGKTLKGYVFDAHNDPLVGVVVGVEGTSNGTQTRLDGDFLLNNVAPGSTITFSYIGFTTQKIKWDGQGELKVILQEEAELLEEVVITAVGLKQMKRKIGYSTQQIKSDVLERQSTLNLGSSLSGQIAGLRVTNPTGLFQQPEITIRGQRPLLVVDGMPISSDLFDINSSDVESINVLKGTSASALYGSRGKNGAIIINTKSGKEEGLHVTAQISTMFTAGFTVFPKVQKEYGGGSQGQYEFWDGADGGISDGDMIWGPKFAPGVLLEQWNSPIRNKQTGEVIPWWGDVAGTIYDNRGLYERVPIPWEYHPNLENFLRVGNVTQTNISIASKGKKTSTYASANFAYQRGQVPNTSLRSGGISINHIANFTDNLSLSINSSFLVRCTHQTILDMAMAQRITCTPSFFG